MNKLFKVEFTEIERRVIFGDNKKEFYLQANDFCDAMNKANKYFNETLKPQEILKLQAEDDSQGLIELNNYILTTIELQSINLVL